MLNSAVHDTSQTRMVGDSVARSGHFGCFSRLSWLALTACSSAQSDSKNRHRELWADDGKTGSSQCQRPLTGHFTQNPPMSEIEMFRQQTSGAAANLVRLRQLSSQTSPRFATASGCILTGQPPRDIIASTFVGCLAVTPVLEAIGEITSSSFWAKRNSNLKTRGANRK